MGEAKISLKLIFLFLTVSISLQGEVLRVASFNLQNYLSCDRIVDGDWRPNYPKPEIEKKSVRSIIRSVNPDILAVQEMGEYAHFLELWNDLNNTGGPYYNYGAWKPNKDEDEVRHLSILTKIKPLEIINHTKISFKYFDGLESSGRGLQEILFNLNGAEFRVFNLHLKSMWTERKDDLQAKIRREKEARTIRDLIREKYPPSSNPEYLIVGDFNDHKDSAPLKRFTKVNEIILSHRIPCVDSRGHYWTHFYRKQDSYSRIDYILATPSIKKRFIANSAWIMDEKEASIASDHRMIYADFSF